jgi:hypothetical protein
MTPSDPLVLTGAEFDALFDGFRFTAERLETLPAYAVGGAEAERLAARQADRPRPERSVRTDPWLARMARSTVIDGKRWRRVRIVDRPLTDYQRYQLDSYVESATTGEEIVLVPRDESGDDGSGDFWLFDAETPAALAVLMHYHADGRVEGHELVRDRERIDVLRARLQAVARRAKPLNDFLADLRRRG